MVQHKPSIHYIILVYSKELCPKDLDSNRDDIMAHGTCEEVPLKRELGEKAVYLPGVCPKIATIHFWHSLAMSERRESIAKYGVREIFLWRWY